MKRKQIGIMTISLIVIGLMISVSATSIVQTSEEQNKITIKKDHCLERSITQQATVFDIQSVPMSQPSNTLGIPLFEGMHPTIATGGATLLMGFDDLELVGTWFSASPDGGQSWTDGVGWDLGQTEYPSIDYSSGSTYFGTVTPDFTTSGQNTLLEFRDINNQESWTGRSWDWEQYDVYDFEDCSIACGDGSLEEWRFGFITFSGYFGYDGANVNGCPYLFFATDDGYATLTWLENSEEEPLSGCSKASSALDKETLLHYGIWQRESETGYSNIQVRCDTFEFNSDADDNYIWSGELETDENNLNPDVCAHNDNVIVVSEVNGNIVAYYSFDGLESMQTSVVVTDAQSPRITSLGNREALCSFVKNGELYASSTQDGGATWSTPGLISDGGVYDDYRESDISEGGAIYTGTDDVIYFEPEIGTARPIITIDGVSGGFGVTVSVQNIGSGDGTDIPYSITATGGLLGMVNKNAEGTISSLAAGGSTTISLPMIIGLGSITIDISVDAATESIQATQLLVYTSV